MKKQNTHTLTLVGITGALSTIAKENIHDIENDFLKEKSASGGNFVIETDHTFRNYMKSERFFKTVKKYNKDFKNRETATAFLMRLMKKRYASFRTAYEDLEGIEKYGLVLSNRGFKSLAQVAEDKGILPIVKQEFLEEKEVPRFKGFSLLKKKVRKGEEGKIFPIFDEESKNGYMLTLRDKLYAAEQHWHVMHKNKNVLCSSHGKRVDIKKDSANSWLKGSDVAAMLKECGLQYEKTQKESSAPRRLKMFETNIPDNGRASANASC